MARRHYVNNAATVQTSGSLTSGATTVTISDLSTFPATFPYTAEINAGQSDAEVVLVNAATGNNITSMTRGYDGTAAQSHASNATFQHVAVKADYDEANSHVNASNNVHGVVGSVVGTSDAQTLTNKTHTAPVVTGGITVSGTAALANNATVGGTLGVTGAATLSGAATVVGDFKAGAGSAGKYIAYESNFSQSAVPTGFGSFTTVTNRTTAHSQNDYSSPWSSHTFAAPVAGWYEAFIHMDDVADSTGNSCTILRNGTVVARCPSATATVYASCPRLWLDVSDTISFQVAHAAGANRTVTGFTVVARKL